MLKNYLLVALRNAKRNKFHIVVNVLGLGLGLACCLTAYLLLAFNLEFDAYFENTSSLYRVQRTLAGDRASDGLAEILPLPLAGAIEQDITGVVASSRVFASSDLLSNEDQDVYEEFIGYVDTNFFELFPFSVVSGELGSFSSQNTVVLSQNLATKLFGQQAAVGNTLTLRLDDGQEIPLQVSAVVSYPKNISFHYDAFVALPQLIKAMDYDEDNWEERLRPSVFLALKDKAAVERVSQSINNYVAVANATDITYPYGSFGIIPFVDNSVNEVELRRSHTNRRINPLAIKIFGTLSLTILLLACFNFTNTSIALASRRLKEIGVRKVMGGMRYQLIFQSLFEVLAIGLLAVAAGWLFAQYLAPAFTSEFDMGYSLQDINLVNMAAALVLLLLLISTVAGIYPALYSTRFHPASILKGSLKLKGSNWLTRTLLTLQFALSIILLIGGFVSVKNSDFLSELDMGFDVKQLISLQDLEPDEVQALMNSVRQYPGVENLSAIRGSAIWGNLSDVVKVDTTTVDSKIFKVDANYFATTGMEVTKGRGFDNRTSDFTEAVLVNEHFAKQMGWDNPINQRIIYQDTARYVVGVVTDIVGDIYDNDTYPSVFKQVAPEEYSRLLVRAQPEDLTAIFDYLEKEWKRLTPYKPFSAEYLTQTAMGYPLREMRVFKKVFFFLALLGTLLATVGIFSLAQINVARRSKEIGVRKVLGASVNGIISTLSREFVWVLAIALLVGGALGYFFHKALLDNIYAFHAEIGFLPVFFSGLLVVGMAILTTSLTIRRSALSNPAHILRDE